ncbi:MAG: hypothetical protein DRN20_06665 [Thermoplasmata archaeon]|nr:MAG: hypothetical protein DRN20_06665 [Thermoplasmata archaeon]
MTKTLQDARLRQCLADVLGKYADVVKIRWGEPIGRTELANKLGIVSYYSHRGNEICGIIAFKLVGDKYESLPYMQCIIKEESGSVIIGEKDSVEVAQKADLAVDFYVCEWACRFEVIFRDVKGVSDAGDN